MGWTTKESICFTVASLLFALCLSAEPAVAQTPTPSPGGDCCSEHSGPACDSSACTTCVCDGDPLCCDPDFGWDEFCVSSASDPKRCAGECPCVSPTPTPGGDCCSPHEGASCDDSACATCVCGLDEVCCEMVWDATCVVLAGDECADSCGCEAPPTPTPTRTPTPGGNCCTAHGGPECDDARCESCVCDVDSFCCENAWDQRCANVASVECAVDCPCDQTISCCTSHDGVGCSDMRCQDCVCALDQLCCDELWDETCASRAFEECAVDCECEAAGDCCVANQGLGCDEVPCQDCVCAIDPFCCTGEWDQRCVDVTMVECSASCFCDMAPCCEAHEELGCDEPTCQECVCALDETCCTEVWDDICASEAMIDCGERCTCEVSDCCVAGDDPGCADSTCEECVCAIDSACCDDIWDGTCTDIASNIDECAADCPCGPAATPTPTATPTPGGSCCSPHGGPECDDSACEACVCGIDEACCDNVWDATCADIASEPDDCAASCPCVSDCCFGREDTGCDDSPCESCVCGIDQACCNSVWDGTCASIASNPDECATSCMCVCPGDCAGDGLTIDDLIQGVNILLGESIDVCRQFDANGDGEVTVDEVVQALAAALAGCENFVDL